MSPLPSPSETAKSFAAETGSSYLTGKEWDIIIEYDRKQIIARLEKLREVGKNVKLQFMDGEKLIVFCRDDWDQLLKELGGS